MTKVFLGGTCNQSTWREELIALLDIDYFNPVVEEGDWTDEHRAEEKRQRESCDYCLYVITPKMTGTYSIAEVIDDSNKRPEKTLFYFSTTDGDLRFDDGQVKSLVQVGLMVNENGGKFCSSLDKIAIFLNQK